MSRRQGNTKAIELRLEKESDTEHNENMEHVRNLFQEVFDHSTDEQFINHDLPTRKEVTAFTRGDGAGPTMLGLHWDLASSMSMPWNQSVLEFLLVKLTEMRLERGWTTQPRSDAYWRDAVGRKFRWIKNLWEKSQPHAGETASQTAVRLMEAKDAKLKKVCADTRRRAKYTHRINITTELASIRSREGNAEGVVWKWLSDMVTTLGVDGMSSEESDEEDFTSVFHVRMMPWRQDLSHELQIIDSYLKGDVSQGPKSARRIRGLTQLTRKAVEGLLKSLRVTPHSLFLFPSTNTIPSHILRTISHHNSMATSFEISPSMVVGAVYPWLESYAKKESTSLYVLQKIEFELGAVGATFDEDRWLDILDYIDTRQNGWEEVKAKWQRIRSAPLLEDKQAWCLLQAWVHGQSNYSVVTEAMEIAYGDRFVHSEWVEIFNPLLEIWEEEEEEEGLSLPPPLNRHYLLTSSLLPVAHYDKGAPPPSHAKVRAKRQKPKADDLRALDMGVIDLTTLGEDDSAKVGPSKAVQKRRETVVPRSISCFLDVSTLDDEDDEDNDDEEDDKDCCDDTPTAGPSQVLPSGWASFTSRVDDICRHYESGHTNIGCDSSNDPLCRPAVFTMYGSVSLYCFNLNPLEESAADYIRDVLEQKSFKVTQGYHHSLYVEATSPKAIQSSVPPGHHSITRKITLVPTEEVAALYSPREVFTSAFWVWVKCGIYKNDIGYVLSRDGDQVDILVTPCQRPYDADRQKLLFDADATRLAGHGVMGLLHQSFLKKVLEVVELPHPNDLAPYSMAGINPPLVHWTIKMFSAQFWQQGDLVCLMEGELRNTLGPIISVDLQNTSATIEFNGDGGLAVQYSCPILHLQCVYRRGDWVKVFAGSDRGTEGYVMDHSTDLTLSVHRYGEVIEILVDPMLVHSCVPDYRVSEVTQRLDTYSHDPELPQDQFRLATTLASLMGHGEVLLERSYGLTSRSCGLNLYLNLLTFPRKTTFPIPKYGYNVTVGDSVQVMRGKYCGETGIVLNVNFCKASMEIRCKDFTLNVRITSCTKISNWTPLSLRVGSDVWVIAGDKKGRRVNLVFLGCQLSVISMLGYPHYEIRNTDVATSMGYLLNGDKLDAGHLNALIALQQRSFVPEPAVPRQQTPPPSRPLSPVAGELDSGKATKSPWTISTSDFSPPSLLDPPAIAQPAMDQGDIPWLFDDAFCPFTDYHICFNVGLGYDRGSLNKHVAVDIFFQAPTNKDNADGWLQEIDWQVIEDMEIVLEVPNSAQQLMSHKTLPVLSCAVPTIETLIIQWEHLSTHLPQCAPYIKTNAYVIMMFVDPTLHLTWMEEHWSSAEVLKVHHVVLEKMAEYRSHGLVGNNRLYAASDCPAPTPVPADEA
ncbi:hypothetical protein SCLCIDRAFT_30313 [Scleroderma citrinum Foug A]|uniref:KOW domain-containing protein n=1 Tax=Scleroderma citrinum Foug A TaxID=1036808 RepID=A0A0C2Z125_9AGAM|nr:hypothetical protein SCLCIDRAFT_30313 [Scleroderma citrinum Foug A]